MKVAYMLIAALALGCTVDEPVAPDTLSLHRSHDEDASGCHPSGVRLGRRTDTIGFLCAIEIPGNPLTSSQKGWAEQSNGRYFLSDASNLGVDVFNIRSHSYVGRIGPMAGAVGTGGGTATTNGAGPNAFVSAPRQRGHGHYDDDDHDRGSDRVLFVSDGNSTVHVVDMRRLRIIKSISTTMPDCDGGTATTKFCGRSNEIAYDPEHHIVAVSNPNPLSHVKCTATGANCTNNAGVTAAGAALEGYLTFISARYPYRVRGHLSFGAGTVEGHIWAPQLNRFLLPMQGVTVTGGPFIAVINARTMQVEDRRLYNCATIPGAVATSTGNNNLQLASGGNLWAQLCGRPIRMDVYTGVIKNVVTQLGTGDQDWYNPGDGNFYVTSAGALGVMNGRTGEFLQAVPNPGGASPSAYAQTNEIFTRVLFSTAAADTGRCVVKGRGCVAVFGHIGAPRNHDRDRDGHDGDDDRDDH